MINHHAEPLAPAAGQRHLCLQDFERAGIRVAERGFGDRDIIYAPGDPDGQLHFLLESMVRLYKIYGQYKEATTALLTEGDVFGKLSLEETPHENAFAEAVTDARVAVVRKSVLNEVIKCHPEFALKLFSSFSERFRQSDETIERLLDREVSARLATLLSHLVHLQTGG
jgi:CRP-like cAMP-binding protein